MTEALLVVRVGAMGDVLHALPAVAAWRQRHPEVRIGWAVDTRWVPLLAGPDGTGPVVSRVHLADTRLWKQSPLSPAAMSSVRALRRELRYGQYGLAVDMQGTLRSAAIGRMAASGALAGFADPRERPARWFYRHLLPRLGRHVVEQGAALLTDALRLAPGAALVPLRDPELPRWPEAERWADQFVGHAGAVPQPFALLSPGAGWAAKRWPAERFGELARRLGSSGLRVLVNGAPGDDAFGRVLEASGGAAQGVTCDVAGLVALTRRAAVVVGPDSGPVHLAAALARPVVALFGPTDPARNGPWGAGPVRILRHPASVTSYRHTAVADPGLAQVEVAEVLAAVGQVLG